MPYFVRLTIKNYYQRRISTISYPENIQIGKTDTSHTHLLKKKKA